MDVPVPSLDVPEKHPFVPDRIRIRIFIHPQGKLCTRTYQTSTLENTQ